MSKTFVRPPRNMATAQSAQPLPKEEWFEAAKNGGDEAITKLLAEWPELAAEVDSEDLWTALHHASKGGHEKVVARLLTARPDLIDARTNFCKWTPLSLAIRCGHDKVVAQLLAAGAATVSDGGNVLQDAAGSGRCDIVSQILAANPSLITTSVIGLSPLALAARSGHEHIVAQLLAICPDLIDRDEDVLNCAAQRGHSNVVEQILALRPDKAYARDGPGWSALMYAVDKGHENIADRLLSLSPDEVYEGPCTLLHLAIQDCSREFVEKLWGMCPEALHSYCSKGKTPFHWAIIASRHDLVELFQWTFSFDEIMDAFTNFVCAEDAEDWLTPVMEKLFEPLLEVLNQDVVGLAFEYIGLKHSRKRKRS